MKWYQTPTAVTLGYIAGAVCAILGLMSVLRAFL